MRSFVFRFYKTHFPGIYDANNNPMSFTDCFNDDWEKKYTVSEHFSINNFANEQKQGRLVDVS